MQSERQHVSTQTVRAMASGNSGCDGVYRWYAHLKELDAKFGALQSPVALLVRHGPVAPRHKGRQPLNVQRRPLVAQLKDGGID